MKAKKLPSGNYRVQVVAGFDPSGKRIVKSFTADTEWEAMRMAEYFKRDREETTGKNITVAKAMEMYIDSRENVIEKTTVRSYRQITNNCFKCIMDVKLSFLRAIDIQRAINIESARVSPKYIKNAYGLLKSVLKMFEVNINLSSIQLPKLVKRKKELPDFETVFGIVKGTEIELPCLLSAWLSFRVGEVVGLQFRDVDTEKKTLKIRRTIIQTVDGQEAREGCKTEKSTRSLNIPDYLFRMIMAIPHKEETDFIVTLTRKAIYSRFKRLMLKNGYDIIYHDLRHPYVKHTTKKFCDNLTKTFFCTEPIRRTCATGIQSQSCYREKRKPALSASPQVISQACRRLSVRRLFSFTILKQGKHRLVIAFSRNSDYILPEYRIFYK